MIAPRSRLLILLGLALGCLPVNAITVGLIYGGPRVDAGWDSAQEEARLYLVKALPEVQTLVAENVPETSESERVMEKMARAGATVIFATSYGYFDEAVRVSKRFPNVAFIYSGDGQLDHNVANYFGSTEQAMYVGGVAAGYKTKSGKLGYVAAHPIPLLLRGINAFTLGAQSVNPKISVEVICLNTWQDPIKEAEAANSLIDKGVDVLSGELNSNSTLAHVAEKRGIAYVGQYYDASALAPHAWLIGNYYKWGPMMVRIVKEVEAGGWKEKIYLAKLGEVLLLTKPNPTLPGEALSRISQVVSEFEDGKRELWRGPIYKQDGTLLVAEGKVLDPGRVTEMDFLVQGTVGTLGN
jgi:basic membrane lipoprotein Med (substrate-binding protein (PBP1-ABC) superfamily)